jgi:ESX secretion-associated protein EspD/H
MVDDAPPHNPDEGDHDNLAALDFTAAQDVSEKSDLDALGEYGAPDEAEDDELPVPLFTLTNPPGTVTVTTFMDGRVHQIDLSSKATTMTETHLAEEIVVIAGLATQDARSAQYAFMLKGMRQQGHDNVSTRDFLARDLDLPSPEEAEAARAQVFATRYAGGHD